MLRKLAILFLTLLTTAVMAQTAPATAPKKPAAKKPATTASQPAAAKTEGALTDDSPVLFVPGLCNIPATADVPAAPVTPKPGAPAQAKCMRQVTKRQFEALIRGLGPRAANADKAKIADFYAHALAIENEARKINLEKKDPDLHELLWMARIGALGDALHRNLQAQFENMPESDIQAFYDQHKKDFEEATIQRVVIPKPPKPAAAAATPPAKPGEKPAEATPESPSATKANDQQAYADKITALKATAEKMLERAKAGEDMAKLQQEAFTAAGMTGKPPDMEPVAIHHNMLPPAHDQKVFALQGGQFTDLIEEPNAYMFYKVVSRREIPLAEVKNEIKQNLATDKEDAAANQFFSESQPVLNPAYFGTPKPQPAGAGKPEGEQPQAEQPEEPQADQPQAPAPKQEQPSEPPKQEQPSAPPKK